MNGIAQKNGQALTQLALQDEIYCVWEHSFLDSQEAFAAFAASQPEEVRNMLYAYADGGRMMLQRKLNLACEHMVFPRDNAGEQNTL